MLILFETPLGYALFKVNKSTFDNVESWKDLPSDVKSVKKLLKLQAFKEFKDAKDVLQASVKMANGKLSNTLIKFLKSNFEAEEVGQKLLINDKKMAHEISKKMNIKCESSDKVLELTRVIRGFSSELFPDFSQEEAKNMALGLAHGLGRFKIKFSADKVDTMIIQAISLHSDLDKEINNYMMRLREWYGYHFPELSQYVSDNIVYTRVARAIGNRVNSSNAELAEFVGEDVEAEIKRASDMSMGTDITENDVLFITGLADQILELDSYRTNLEDYLKNRMMTVAPNLSMLVGEVIAAKLIAKAGSLINLAKFSASTIQIMGAEKALFKAMKTKKQTPKYGIIYQSKLLASVNGRNKGKIARSLASKAALCVRFDALAEEEENCIGTEASEYLDKRLKYLEDTEKKAEGKKTGFNKFNPKQSNAPARGDYNKSNDFSMQKREGYAGGQQVGFKKQKF